MSRFFIFLLVISLSSCCAKKNISKSAKKQETITGKWQIKSITNFKNFSKKSPTLSFEKNMIMGNAGCNEYSSKYTLKENKISFGLINSTKMMCKNSKSEKAFFDALKKIKTYEIRETKLIFFNEKNNEVMTCSSQANNKKSL